MWELQGMEEVWFREQPWGSSGPSKGGFGLSHVGLGVKGLKAESCEGAQPQAGGAVQEFRAAVGRGWGQSQTASLHPFRFPKTVSGSGRGHRRPLALGSVCAK